MDMLVVICDQHQHVGELGVGVHDMKNTDAVKQGCHSRGTGCECTRASPDEDRWSRPGLYHGQSRIKRSWRGYSTCRVEVRAITTTITVEVCVRMIILVSWLCFMVANSFQ